MTEIWISAAALCAATMMGAAIGVFIKELSHKWNDIVMGFCAGVMLAAATVGLIVPAFESGECCWWIVAAGVIGGALFLNVIDLVTPHLHHITGLEPEQHRNNSSLNRIMLFVLAIAIHKLPEGIAAGVSLSDVSTSVAVSSPSWMVTIGLSLQNIPEGMVIIAPLLLAGVSMWRTMMISLTIGLLEVVGVLLGFGLGNISAMMLPVMLGFAGGAMLYVTSDEIIPETHTHGYQRQATYALLVGFMTLIVIEKFV